MKRTTIKNEVSMTGIGLHKGDMISIVLKPNKGDNDYGLGIIFKRIDIVDRDNVVKVCHKNLFDLERGTNIKNEDNVKIYTIEHFLSSLSALGITDIIVEITGNELPILDGSSIQFVEKLQESGLEELETEIEPIIITEPLIYKEEKAGKYVLAIPYDGFKISYTIDFNHSFLKSQYYEIDLNLDEYIEKISRSRTFAFDYEIDFLKKNNLALGGSLDNAIVVGKDGPLNPEGLRYHDEFVKHKILDIIGDLYVLGKPIRGHIIAIKAGHYVNAQMSKMISKKYLKK